MIWLFQVCWIKRLQNIFVYFSYTRLHHFGHFSIFVFMSNLKVPPIIWGSGSSLCTWGNLPAWDQRWGQWSAKAGSSAWTQLEVILCPVEEDDDFRDNKEHQERRELAERRDKATEKIKTCRTGTFWHLTLQIEEEVEQTSSDLASLGCSFFLSGFHCELTTRHSSIKREKLNDRSGSP